MCTIRDFIIPQIVYCPVILTVMKLPQVLVNSLPSQVAINLEIMEKHTMRKLYVMYRNSKLAFSEENFRTFCY